MSNPAAGFFYSSYKEARNKTDTKQAYQAFLKPKISVLTLDIEPSPLLLEG